MDVGAGFSELRLTARDATPAADDLYDLYVYDRSPAYRLLASTHPFAAEGVTDTNANGARCSQPPCAPASLTLSPQALGPPGRYYVAVNRAKSGGTKTGDFGAYVFTVDEVHPPADLSP